MSRPGRAYTCSGDDSAPTSTSPKIVPTPTPHSMFELPSKGSKTTAIRPSTFAVTISSLSSLAIHAHRPPCINSFTHTSCAASSSAACSSPCTLTAPFFPSTNALTSFNPARRTNPPMRTHAFAMDRTTLASSSAIALDAAPSLDAALAASAASKYRSSVVSPISNAPRVISTDIERRPIARAGSVSPMRAPRAPLSSSSSSRRPLDTNRSPCPALRARECASRARASGAPRRRERAVRWW